MKTAITEKMYASDAGSDQREDDTIYTATLTIDRALAERMLRLVALLTFEDIISIVIPAPLGIMRFTPEEDHSDVEPLPADLEHEKIHFTREWFWFSAFPNGDRDVLESEEFPLRVLADDFDLATGRSIPVA